MVHVFSSLQVASCDFCDSKMPSGFQWFVGLKLHQWKKRWRSFDIWRSNNKLWQPRWNPRHGFRVISVVSIRSVWVSFCQGFLNNVPFRELLTCHIIKLAGVCLARLVRDSWTVSIRSWEIMIISWMLSSNQLLSWQQLSRHFKQGIHSLRNWTCWCGGVWHHYYTPCVHVFYLCVTLQDVHALQAHQKELDSFQKLVEDHDERLKVIQQESTQLMNAQQATEEDKRLDGVVKQYRGLALFRGWRFQCMTIWILNTVCKLLNASILLAESTLRCRCHSSFDQLKSLDIIWYEIAVVGMFDVGCIWKGPR